MLHRIVVFVSFACTFQKQDEELRGLTVHRDFIDNFFYDFISKILHSMLFLTSAIFLEGHICQYLSVTSLNSNRKCQLYVDKSWLNNFPQNSCFKCVCQEQVFLSFSEEFAFKRFVIFDKERLCTLSKWHFQFMKIDVGIIVN